MADTKTTPARALAAAAAAAARRAVVLLEEGRPETQELALRMLEAATRALAQAGPLPVEPVPRSGPVRLPLVPPARGGKTRGRPAGSKELNVVAARLFKALDAAGLVPPKLAALLRNKHKGPVYKPDGGGGGGDGSFESGVLGGFGFPGTGPGGGGGSDAGPPVDGGTPVGTGTGIDGTGTGETGEGTGTEGTVVTGTGTGTDGTGGTGGTGAGPGPGGTEASGPGDDDSGAYVVAVSIDPDGTIDLLAGEQDVVGEAIEGAGTAISLASVGLVLLVLAALTLQSDTVPEAVKPTAEECKQIKEGCLDHCSATALPSGNFGARFNKCMRGCMEDAGCFYNPPAWKESKSS
jgi:hypothetical protein